MKDEKTSADLEFSFDYPQRREQLWRAISVSELRERWLPDQKVLTVLEERPLERLSLLMEETEAPHLRSVVSFTLADRRDGGAVLTIHHQLSQKYMPANSNAPVMLAA